MRIDVLFIIVVLLSLFLNAPMLSQPQKVSVTYENKEGSYVFTADNQYLYPVTITVTFSKLLNLQADAALPYTGTVQPGVNRLFTLKKSGIGGSPSFQYRTKYWKGCINTKIDEDIVYAIPTSTQKETSIFKLSYIGSQHFGKDEPSNWYAIGFRLDEGDTIFNVRRGTVVEVKKNETSGTDLSYSAKASMIEIVHQDCSFSRFSVLKDVLVEEGEKIEVGTPIGIGGGSNYSSGSHVRYSNYFRLNLDTESNNWGYHKMNFQTKYHNTTVLQEGISYTSTITQELLFQEMNKREKKRWLKNNSATQ